jgi:hypothetical protein
MLKLQVVKIKWWEKLIIPILLTICSNQIIGGEINGFESLYSWRIIISNFSIHIKESS